MKFINVEFKDMQDYKMNLTDFDQLIDLYESYPDFS